MAKLHSRIDFNPRAVGAVGEVSKYLDKGGFILHPVFGCPGTFDILYAYGDPRKCDEFEVASLKSQPGVMDVYLVDAPVGQPQTNAELATT